MGVTSEDVPRREERRPSGRVARRVVHYGLLAVVLASPLFIGGALPWSQVLLSAALLAVSAVWAVSRRGDLKLPPFAGLASLAVGFTLLQLVPLPQWLLGALSPRSLELQTSVVGGNTGFLPVTLDRPATVLAALKGFACLAILLVSASATRWRGRTAMFVVPLVMSTGALAMLSFGQRWLGASSILGLYTVSDMPGSGVYGTFVNGNNAASLFMLAAILGIGCLRELDGPVKLGTGIAATVCILAVGSTYSRVGVIATAVGLFAMAVLWLFRRFGKTVAFTTAGALAFIGAPLTVVTALGLRGQLEQRALSAALTEQKVRGWGDALKMTVDFPWTGVGRGAFEAPATGYRADLEGVRLVFPENLLVQMVSEWGIPLAIALLAMFLLACFPVVRRVTRWEPLYQAAACGVLAVLVHEMADFGLEMPGVAFPTALALGLVAGRASISASAAASEDSTARRVRWPVTAGALGIWTILVGFGLWAAPRTADSDGEKAAALVKARAPGAAEELAAMIRRHPADYFFDLQAARHAMMAGRPTTLRHINRALQLNPQSPTPHYFAFHYLARIGLRSQAAIEYRLAVERGYTFSHEEVIGRVGIGELERAAPQRPESLLKLATVMLAAGRVKEAETISARAVGLATDAKPLESRLELALGSGDKAFIRKAATALANVTTTMQGLLLAAEGLARSGDLPAARALLTRLLQQHPNDGALMVRAARLLFTHGDLEAASALLRERGHSNFPMPDRVAGEELTAQIAEKQGLTEVAAAARSRARALQRLHERSAASHNPPQ